MFINRQVYMEEASADGEAGGGAEVVAEQVAEQSVDQSSVEEMANEKPEWLQNKYVTEGKTEVESIAEQAKAYNELSSKFGSFTGSPENYEVALSEELTGLGVEFDKDDPMLEAAMKFAKDSNMSQEGFNGMVELYAMQEIAEQKATEDFKAEQLKSLGPNADSRLENINQWASKNLDAEAMEGLRSIATSAEHVKTIERIISMTRNASVDVSEVSSNTGASAEDVNAMQFEKDQNGNRRINTDPEFKKRYQKLRNDVYGMEDHKIVVNG